MRTQVAEMLGVEFPICAFSHCRDVVAAVSKAGGFGVLGAVGHSPEMLETELTWIEENTDGRPYGVDLLLPPKYVGAEDGGIDAKQVRALLPEECFLPKTVPEKARQISIKRIKTNRRDLGE